MDILSKFNTTVKEFIRDLLIVFPDDSEFQMLQLGITTAMFADNALVQRKFHDKVTVPYESYIVQKDEQFFLNNSFDEVKKGDGEMATQLIKKLKDYWVELDTHNRDMVWKYLKVLILLDKKIQAQAQT